LAGAPAVASVRPDPKDILIVALNTKCKSAHYPAYILDGYSFAKATPYKVGSTYYFRAVRQSDKKKEVYSVTMWPISGTVKGYTATARSALTKFKCGQSMNVRYSYVNEWMR
jgi:hypothetical protein